MKSFANLLATTIPTHNEAMKNLLYARGYTKKEVCRTDLNTLVRQDGRLLLSVFLDEACKISAISKMQKEGICHVIQLMLHANFDQNKMPANIIWIGPPRKDGDDTFSVKSLAIDMPKQRINFWVLDKYAHYYQGIFNAYQNVHIIPVLNYTKKLDLVFSDKNTIYDDLKFYLEHPELFGNPARLYVTIVDYIKIIYQWYEAGFVLDTNVLIYPSNKKGQPITHLPVPTHSIHRIQSVEIVTKPYATPGRPDIWFLYSSDQLRLPLSLEKIGELKYSGLDSVKCLEYYRQAIYIEIKIIKSKQDTGKILSCASINKCMSDELVAPAIEQAYKYGSYYCRVNTYPDIGLMGYEGHLGEKKINFERSAFAYSDNDAPIKLVKFYQNSHLPLTQADRNVFKHNLRYHLSAIAPIWIFQKYIAYSSITHIDNLTYLTMTCSAGMRKGEYPNGLTPEKWLEAQAKNVQQYHDDIEGSRNKNKMHDLTLVRNIPVMHCTIMHEVIFYGNAAKLDQLISILSKRNPASLEKMSTIEVVVVESGVQKTFTPLALADYLNRTGCLKVFEKYGYKNDVSDLVQLGIT